MVSQDAAPVCAVCAVKTLETLKHHASCLYSGDGSRVTFGSI
jgi:hypothetical protein